MARANFVSVIATTTRSVTAFSSSCADFRSSRSSHQSTANISAGPPETSLSSQSGGTGYFLAAVLAAVRLAICWDLSAEPADEPIQKVITPPA